MKIYFNSFIALTFILLTACGTNNKKAEKKSEKVERSEVVEKKEERDNIIFFGNSLTAGYGVES